MLPRLSFVALLLVVACGDRSDDDETVSYPPARTSAGLFDSRLSDHPCRLLRPEMVSAVARVDEDDLKQSEVARMCIYSWEGGSASIAFIRAFGSPADARARFFVEHHGFADPETETRGATFESVDGLGDEAVFDTTATETRLGDRTVVSYANNLDVLVENLTFDVSFTRADDAATGRLYREENVALARAVLEGLP